MHYVLVFLSFLNFIMLSNSDKFLGRRVKRLDIDLQTCIDNFDIHKDKIIRTQDSQNMGAKYLNEIDLGSREECLRLCCETDLCDVFVFEEKNSGGCYLFHCGPPEDFKCKFTHHVNYSSAVLAISRRLPDLESQIKLTKHEQDLSKLRKPESEPEVIPQIQQIPTTPSTTTTTVKTKEVLSDIPKTQPPESRKCSIYQFECRSTGECIAIYNACDGIPQCADGSDEAPELGCPHTITTPQVPLAVPRVSNSNPLRTRYEQSISPTRIRVPAMNIVQENFRQPAIQENISPQIQTAIQRERQQQEPDFIRSDSRGSFDSRLQYDTSQISPYNTGQISLQPQSNWIPHQANQLTQPITQYSDKNSHIFNHKETGLQVPDGQDISQLQYVPEPINSRDYPKIPGYYAENYRPSIAQEAWNAPPDDSRYSNMRYEQEGSNKDWRPDIAQDQFKKPVVSNKQPVTEPPLPPPPPKLPVDKVAENPKHIQEKMAHELKQSKSQTHSEASSDPKIKIERHRHTEKVQYPEVVAYKMNTSPELLDGKSQTPGGAVLSLTFGLIITCIMAILIGCRLRVVRRRMRKGGKSYAHDADYLVNGMYL